MQDENLKIEVKILPKDTYAEETILKTEITDDVHNVLKEESDVEAKLNKLMKLKEDGLKFSYGDAGEILKLP